MRALFRPASLFVLLTYFVLSAVPFASLALGRELDHPLQLLSMELIVWMAIFAVFKRPVWFHCLLLPAFIALPTEIYLLVFYGQGISSHHLGIIAETSPRESLEFLGAKVWLLGGVLLIAIGWWLASWRAAYLASALKWSHSSRWIFLLLLSVGLVTWEYGREFGLQTTPGIVKTSAKSAASASSSADDAEEDEEVSEEDASASTYSGPLRHLQNKYSPSAQWPKLSTWANIPLTTETFAKTWPFGLVMRGYDFWTERQYLSKLGSTSSTFKFGAHQDSHADEPQIVVMVIGESSRYDRWSLNGYSRDTNPLLKAETNIVALRDIITSVSATRLSVPVIISRKPAMQSLKDGFNEKSFLTAFKEAGFKTYWLSNQMSFGQFDTPVSVFAKEADVVQFMNLGGFTNTSNFDNILLEPLANAIKDPAQKKLIVLHTLGSHWNYSHRHPEEFDKWKPSLFGIENPAYTDLKLKAQLNNSYDNSVLYTDWLLSQVIKTLKQSNQLSAMLYVSDHGQTLYDGSCHLAFHGHNTQYEFHIPAFVWYSDQYAAAYPEKINQLHRHQKARLSTENVFHSLLDISDIRYNTEHLEWSFFSSQFKRHKRYVDSYGWTNYDNAGTKGDCREMIDKGKPLTQEK